MKSLILNSFDNVLTWPTAVIKEQMKKTNDENFKKFLNFVLHARRANFFLPISLKTFDPRFLEHVKLSVGQKSKKKESEFIIVRMHPDVTEDLVIQYLQRVQEIYPGSMVRDEGTAFAFYIAWNTLLQKTMQEALITITKDFLREEIIQTLQHLAVRELWRHVSAYPLRHAGFWIRGQNEKSSEKDVRQELETVELSFTEKFFCTVTHFTNGVSQFDLAWKFCNEQEWSCILRQLEYQLTLKKNGGYTSHSRFVKSQIMEKFLFLGNGNMRNENRAGFYFTASSGKAEIGGVATVTQVKQVLEFIRQIYPEAVLEEASKIEELSWRGKYHTNWVINLNNIPKRQKVAGIPFPDSSVA